MYGGKGENLISLRGGEGKFVLAVDSAKRSTISLPIPIIVLETYIYIYFAFCVLRV